jgi:hypothetical protein
VPKLKQRWAISKPNKLYSLQTFKGSFGYLWKENERKEHLLNVTEITSPQNITELYQSQINTNTSLGKVIEKQLILVLLFLHFY